MNISQESTGLLTTTVCIEVDKSDYQPKVDDKLREYRRKVKMPGFREGKVPVGVVNKMYGKAILVDEINNLISEALENYLNEQDIQTLASPLPNRDKQEQIDFDTQETFSFYFDLALRPEVKIDLGALKKIRLYEIESDESKVDEYIAHIRKSFGKFEETDIVEESSLVSCDIVEINDAGEEFTGCISTSSVIAVDKISDKDIKEQFVGAQAGAVIVMNPLDAFGNKTEVAAMLNMKPEELQEPLNRFNFKINSIRRLVPADIDEKLLAEVFPRENLQSEEELRERVRKDITASYEREAQTLMFNDTLEALLEATNVALPDEFLRRWLLEADDKGDTTQDDIDKNYDTYAQQLKTALIRNQLIVDHDIKVEEDDFYSYIFRMMGIDHSAAELDEARKMSVQHIIDNISKDKKQMERVQERIMEEKVAQLMMETVPYTKENITADAFSELVKEK